MWNCGNMFLRKYFNLKSNTLRFYHENNIHKINRTMKPGDSVTIKGWIQNIRKLKKNYFLDISDGSTLQKLQTVVSKSFVNEKPFSIGQSVEFDGILQESPQKHLELNANQVRIVNDCNIADGVYPFSSKQSHSHEYVREYLHLRPKINYMQCIFRTRSRVAKILRDFMDENNFIEIHTPIITGNDCENAGEVFSVRPDSIEILKQMNRNGVKTEDSYFDQKVFLSVSGQLHLEAMCHGLGDCYTLTPAFRAENSRSPLHLAEFYMFEAELAFCSDLKDLCKFIETLIKTVTTRSLNKCEEDIYNCCENHSPEKFKWLENSWAFLTYAEALDILNKFKQDLKTEIRPSAGLSKEQELFLVQYCNSPVFIIEWPKEIKPFYMRQLTSDPEKVSGLDLLMPGIGELIGGSLRENSYETLQNNGVPNGLAWYLDLRKYGGIPTGGFGLGFERYMQLLTGVKNIRDVIPYPRYPHNCRM